MNIVGMVLGILSCVFISLWMVGLPLGVVGFPVSIIGYRKYNTPGVNVRQVIAVAGIITSLVGVSAALGNMVLQLTGIQWETQPYYG